MAAKDENSCRLSLLEKAQQFVSNWVAKKMEVLEGAASDQIRKHNQKVSEVLRLLDNPSTSIDKKYVLWLNLANSAGLAADISNYLGGTKESEAVNYQNPLDLLSLSERSYFLNIFLEQSFPTNYKRISQDTNIAHYTKYLELIESLAVKISSPDDLNSLLVVIEKSPEAKKHFLATIVAGENSQAPRLSHSQPAFWELTYYLLLFRKDPQIAKNLLSWVSINSAGLEKRDRLLDSIVSKLFYREKIDLLENFIVDGRQTHPESKVFSIENYDSHLRKVEIELNGHRENMEADPRKDSIRSAYEDASNEYQLLVSLKDKLFSPK
jgi:hypothetical protein